MRLSNSSKMLPLPVRRVLCSVFASSVAASLLLSGLTGCSSSDGDAKVENGGSGSGSGSGPSGQAGLPDLMLPPSGGAPNGSGGAGGGDPTGGVYMLPAGFTKAQMGGYKLGEPLETGTAGASGSGGGAGDGGTGGGSAGASSCGTQILGVVRDFKGVNEMGGHPDFEAFSGKNASPGIVKKDLGDDQKPVYASSGPFTDPKNGQQTTSKDAFDQWYRATPDVNKPYLVYFYFQPAAGNMQVLTFQSTAFFPLDGKGWGNTCSGPGAKCPSQDHNFGFTTEVHTQFNYRGKETFSFTGDDDLWVFINHKLAIDLGGLHAQLTDRISLDDEAATLGIKVGGTYDLDLFHAERHTSASNFRVDTNLAFTNCGTVIDEPPVK